jgi:hypothetical protein
MHEPSEELKMSAADARVKQDIANVLEGIRNDIPAFGELAGKINKAAMTRHACGRTGWTEEQKWQMVRLANIGAALMTARLLDRKLEV